MSAYYSLVVIGLCLLMGYAGQISLGHAGFFAIGGYTSAVLTTCDLAAQRSVGLGGRGGTCRAAHRPHRRSTAHRCSPSTPGRRWSARSS